MRLMDFRIRWCRHTQLFPFVYFWRNAAEYVSLGIVSATIFVLDSE